MGNIDIDFVKAQKQARELRTLASNLKKMSQRSYADTLQRISGDWQGESASAFLAKGNKLKDEILATAEALEAVADNVSETARRIYLAEKRAEQIAKERAAKR